MLSFITIVILILKFSDVVPSDYFSNYNSITWMDIPLKLFASSLETLGVLYLK